MSLAVTIVMLVSAWMAVAGAMLWGVMRISRRHHAAPSIKHPQPLVSETGKPFAAADQAHHHATAH